ncbi:phosphatase PAP2 family protein [Microvirga alba]|uniref:Phosphatase PAP2 family protein n=1 Tax=Microvirga alba TaxID=2791025 RepID=A0A931FNI4_9HYPH|nr:phosphatase PAP2 family protein [Microvirga alba]MBF9234064.1 phosphatase PAP2 family protein [Microvirga alba]
MKRQALLIAGLLALCLSPATHAVAKDKARLTVVIDTAQVGTPPDAAATAKELASVLSTQAERTPSREELAVADAKQSLSSFLKGMDATADKDGLKKARRLFKEATAALEEALAPVKGRFERPRPFRASAEVKTCQIKLPPSSSFPSTHAGTGTLFAALLAHIAPERKTELEARGLDYGWSRVVCGFHYPSDIEAGRTGGRLAAAALLNDPAFVKRLDNVAPELRGALGL